VAEPSPKLTRMMGDLRKEANVGLYSVAWRGRLAVSENAMVAKYHRESALPVHYSQHYYVVNIGIVRRNSNQPEAISKSNITAAEYN